MAERTKRCSKCKSLQKIHLFSKDKDKLDGLSSHCKSCCSLKNKKYYINNKDKIDKRTTKYAKEHPEIGRRCSESYRKRNPDKIREYYQNNKERLLKQTKIYRQVNKEKICIRESKYREKNRDRERARIKEWDKKNKDRRYARFRERYKTDPKFKLTEKLRKRLGVALKKQWKAGSAVRDLGCSVSELKTRLERMFYFHSKTGEMMTWNNYGLGGWQIDHIIPLSSFSLTDRGDFLEANHWTNLQPMWQFENRNKSNYCLDDPIKNIVKVLRGYNNGTH